MWRRRRATASPVLTRLAAEVTGRGRRIAELVILRCNVDYNGTGSTWTERRRARRSVARRRRSVYESMGGRAVIKPTMNVQAKRARYVKGSGVRGARITGVDGTL